MHTTTLTPTGSLAILVRATDPLFSAVAHIAPLSEDAPLYRSVVADLGVPGHLVGAGRVVAGEVLA